MSIREPSLQDDPSVRTDEDGMIMPARSNQEWLKALGPGSPEQTVALQELRETILRAILGYLGTHRAGHPALRSWDEAEQGSSVAGRYGTRGRSGTRTGRAPRCPARTYDVKNLLKWSMVRCQASLAAASS